MAHSRHSPQASRPGRGFSLVEVLITLSIIGIVLAIGVPIYRSAVANARVSKATDELRIISQSIGIFRSRNNGALPVSLAEVGYGERLDPWGHPYCYLNYSTGTGDGLAWAVRAGLLDPTAAMPASPPTTTTTTSGGGSSGPGGGGSGGGGGLGGLVGGLLGGSGGSGGSGSGGSGSGGSGGNPGPGGGSGSGSGSGSGGLVGGLITRVTDVLTSLGSTLTDTQVTQVVRAMQDKSTPVYVAVPVATVRRRDQYLFPLNTDYDLFSLGPDGDSAVALGNLRSLDDVIRANDGGYFGPAANY